jgi:hypothetical protein
MQRNFEPMRKQVEMWQRSELTDVTVKVVIYEAFVEGRLEAPKRLARTAHDLHFEPKYEGFRPRTIWSLSNAFTSAFNELDPIPQFRATAKLGEFLEAWFSQSFQLWGSGLGADRSFFASERCAEDRKFSRIQPSTRRLMAEECLSEGNECERVHDA